MKATEMDDARTKRVVFHEITPKAVQEAFEHRAQSTWIW
jgi:DNA topoisomerase IA